MKPKEKDLLGRWPRVALLLALFLPMVLSWPTPSAAQVSNPWDSIEGKFCFEKWTIEALYRVNTFQGSADFNTRKPWRINPYGVLEGNPRLGPRSTAPPEDFHRYNSNKYWWMWDHYSPDPVAGWSLPDWNEAGVPPLRDYVWGCLSQAGGRTSPMPMPSFPSKPPSAPSVVSPPAAIFPPSVMGEMPQAQIPPAGQAPFGVRVRVAAYGKDETDGSEVGWNSQYPNPSFDDDPGRRGSPNARWQGAHYWEGNRLCLAIRNLEAPYPPAHTLAVGYSVTLQGGFFEDGSGEKTFLLYRFSGVPGQKNITECYQVTTTAPGVRPTPMQGGWLEELIVPNTRPEKVLSRTVLEVGKEYIIEASGTWDDWGNTPHGIDAVWCFAEWRCGRQGEAWNQLRLDGKGMTEVAGQTIPYNPQHIYRIRYKGQGKPVEFYSSDALTSWSDNLGAITVRIYGSGVATEPTPLPVPTMPPTPTTSQVPPSGMGGMPQAQIPPAGQAPFGVRVRVTAYGKDETDGSEVGWNSQYPNPSFDDDPGRRGSPNARWQGAHYWEGNRLCLAIRNLEAPYPPAHTLAVGYSVTLQGGFFEDGSAKKTFLLYRFSGVPGRRDISECYLVVTAAPASIPPMAAPAPNLPAPAVAASPPSSPPQVAAPIHTPAPSSPLPPSAGGGQSLPLIGGGGICGDPRTLSIMDEWLSRAIPPQNPGESLRYEPWGRLVGRSSTATLKAPYPPDTKMTRCEYLWAQSATLRSTNGLGTLREFVEQRRK